MKPRLCIRLQSMLFFVVLLHCSLTYVSGIFQWSHQQTLFVPSASATYGITPAMLTGRGFMTMISGFDPIDPGLFVHTTEDGHIDKGHVVWSQQGKLKVPGVVPADQFGRTMVAYEQTLIVAAPYRSRGAVFVFNGTRRHWSLMQRIVAVDIMDNDYFGESMSLHEDRLAISAKGQLGFTGSVYVYERPPGGYYWSRTARLTARDGAPDNYLAERVAVYGDIVAATARNDNLGDTPPTQLLTAEADYRTGAAYLFKYSGGIWSQQQKLRAEEYINYEKGGSFSEFLDKTLDSRKLGPEIAINANDLILGVTNVNVKRPNRQSVYVFNTEDTASWSLQQKLVSRTEGAGEPYTRSLLNLIPRQSTLLANMIGINSTTTYIFRNVNAGWSLQQKLRAFDDLSELPNPYNASDKNLPYNSSVTLEGIAYDQRMKFGSPTLWGSYLMHGAGPNGGLQIRTQYRNNSCLRLWMSDHFLDGWDTAVLTVRAPDRSNDTFHPHCDQVDPFLVRYCPYQPSEDGIYIVKVFAALQARFFWELSWQVTVEATGETYRGDFSTKMEFYFNATSSVFSLSSIQNEVDLEGPCFRCTRVAFQSWKQLQISGNSAFWPLVVTGAPYYISDETGRSLIAAGSVCEGVTTYECYQTITNGIYILRLGGGPFGRITGYPMRNASWHGCGEAGGLHDQLIFSIKDGKCTPIQKFHYHGRCAVPTVITREEYLESGIVTTASPMYGGTAMPSVSVFGTGQGSAQAHRQHKQRTAALDMNGLLGERSATELPEVSSDASSISEVSNEAKATGRAEEDAAQPDAFQLLGSLMRKRPTGTQARRAQALAAEAEERARQEAAESESGQEGTTLHHVVRSPEEEVQPMLSEPPVDLL